MHIRSLYHIRFYNCNFIDIRLSEKLGQWLASNGPDNEGTSLSHLWMESIALIILYYKQWFIFVHELLSFFSCHRGPLVSLSFSFLSEDFYTVINTSICMIMALVLKICSNFVSWHVWIYNHACVSLSFISFSNFAF